MGFNLTVIGGSLFILITGSVIAARRTRGAVRWLAPLTGGLGAAFVVFLGYGMATAEVMELFTGISNPIRAAQTTIAGAIVSASALLVVFVTHRHRMSARVAAASFAVVVATATLGVWSWAWRVLPV